MCWGSDAQVTPAHIIQKQSGSTVLDIQIEMWYTNNPYLTFPIPQNKNGSGDLNRSHESKITMTDTGKVIHNSIKAEQAPPAAPAN